MNVSLVPLLLLALFPASLQSQSAKPVTTGATVTPSPTPVRNGIDVLVATEFAALRGRRVGLITNHTGVALDGRSTVELLHAADGVTLVALFSPEHGFAGKLDGKVASGEHAGTGLTIHSLYGDHRKPTPAMLDGVDTLVFDIQDVGCRFYTYVSTMGLALEAAAEAKVRFVVLDRPNPIGGTLCEGPITDDDALSFTAHHPIPLRHGMTVGELARMFAFERRLDVDLQVVKMEGWTRRTEFDATGQFWIDPSPNMRTPMQALLYPGVGLVEFTNVSVGRGTDTPFEVVGAPWIDGRALAARLNAAELPGVRFVPIRFTPDASKHANTPCEGVRILVVERRAVHAVRIGLALCVALRDLHGDVWTMPQAAKLLADRAAFDALAAGKSAQEIEATWTDELRAFVLRRERSLLYQ